MNDDSITPPLHSPPAPCTPPIERGAPQCTATSKRSKERCRAPAVQGRSTCRMHGGTAPVGIANHAFTKGFYSKYMPEPLAARHEERLARIAEVKKLDEELCAITNRIADLFSRLESGERSTSWEDVQQAVCDLQNAQNDAERAAAMQSINDAAAKGKTTEQAWRDLISAFHDKAKITAIEAKRAADAGEVASKDDVKTLVLQIVNIVRDHVTDPQQLRGISNDLAIALHGPKKAIAGPTTAPTTQP